jgi:hypothetical protein
MTKFKIGETVYAHGEPAVVKFLAPGGEAIVVEYADGKKFFEYAHLLVLAA